jgi:hypothetical protein
MKALRYINERRVLVGWFIAGATMFLLVYFLLIAGPSTRTVIARAPSPTPQGAATANTIRHTPGLTHISEGVKGCGSAKSSTGHVVVTKSGNSMCAQGGTMYANLMAMHTPRGEIIQMLLGTGTESINGVPVPEYEVLRGLGVPKKLAHKLAMRIEKTSPLFKHHP